MQRGKKEFIEREKKKEDRNIKGGLYLLKLILI